MEVGHLLGCWRAPAVGKSWPGGMELWRNWAGGWNQLVCEVHPNPNRSRVLWNGVLVEEQQEVPGSSHPVKVPLNTNRENALESFSRPSVVVRAAGEFPDVAAGWAVICLEGLVIFPLFWKVAASERI